MTAFNPTKYPNWTSENNPRNKRRTVKRERGPVPWPVTTFDIAEVAGVSYQAAKRSLPRKTNGLAEVVRYVLGRWVARSREVGPGRWSCGVPKCERPAYAAGFCPLHGGAPKPSCVPSGQLAKGDTSPDQEPKSAEEPKKKIMDPGAGAPA